LGLPLRRCLLCDRPATECIRAGRHSGSEISEAAVALLAPLCTATESPLWAGTARCRNPEGVGRRGVRANPGNVRTLRTDQRGAPAYNAP
jgi:hypothetical protein